MTLPLFRRMLAGVIGTGVLLVVGLAAQAQTPVRIARPAAVPVQAAQLDPAVLLEQERKKNRALRVELDAANARIGEMTRLGGREVTAYCPAPTQSRNTAGASSNCGAAGYTCEPVSGLCRTSCQTSDMCAVGFVCDTGAQQCVRP